MKIVLQKFIAESGYCSRRKAEELIRQSTEAHKNASVLVNGLQPELGMKVDEQDEVKVFGKLINLPNAKIYLKLNKPVGYVCTNKSFMEEKNIFQLLPRNFNNLIISGRLDKNSRGLLLLTNDGDLVARLTHPRYEHEKEYIVTIFNFPACADASAGRQFSIFNITKAFKLGINIGEGEGIVRVKKIESLGENRFKIVLTEGKKRQIRRMFRALGLEVKDLVRTRIGSLELGNLKEGAWAYLTKEEIDGLLKG
jgi:pseudouridine synthase